MTRFPFCLALVHAVSNPGAFYSTSRLALQTANAKAAVATIGRQIEFFAASTNDEIDAAFANMVQWRADAAAVIRIVQGMSSWRSNPLLRRWSSAELERLWLGPFLLEISIRRWRSPRVSTFQRTGRCAFAGPSLI